MEAAALKGVAAIAVIAGAAAGFSWFVHYEREIGRAEVQVRWDAERAELKQQVADQQIRNRELQRQSELRYVVQAETREKFIVETVTEIRHETGNLAACVLSPRAVQLLNDTAACARGDRAAACTPDSALPDAR